jgi:hypothetical protein
MHSTNRLLHIATGAAFAFVVLCMPRLSAAAVCEGDCDGDGVVNISELMTGVNILLDDRLASTCTATDGNGDGVTAVYEIIAAVRRALDGCPAPAYPRDDTLRLNQIQVLGTHNSYHIRPDKPVLDQIAAISSGLAMTLEYDHPPLTEQFETQGIRQIELDVFADPVGGLYAAPLGLQVVTGDPNARIPELEAPGFKVLHVQDIDYITVCRTFIACLQEVKAWSDTHSGHAPLMIEIEAKDDVIPDIPPYHFVVPLPIGTAELDAIDAEIRSVFPAAQLITPDDVRGTHATLPEAIAADGWPTLGESRGKVLFCLDNEGKRNAYLNGHPALQGRVMFTPAPSGAPDTAFRKLNDPVGDFDAIQEAVAAGSIVRTRADADTVEARANNTAPREAALSSGAQFVSTDYPVPDPAFGTGYKVEIPMGMPARCNPISAPAECTPLDIENPAHLTTP